MEESFWQARWNSNQIGFHQGELNPWLLRHWHALALPADGQVLVPLCGKSLDLLWLAAQGYRVLGVELSRRAVADFFTEHGLVAQISRHGAFEVWRSDEVELWCGDVFALRAEDLAECAGVYDRAALIALPVAMRERYMALLGELLPAACRGLLVTLDYDQGLIDGPPFSVPDAEVRAGFAGWRVDEVEGREILGESPKFLKAGVESLVERVYSVRR